MNAPLITSQDCREEAETGHLLEPVLVRLQPAAAVKLRRLVRTSRIRQADLLREAVDDLLVKHGAVL